MVALGFTKSHTAEINYICQHTPILLQPDKKSNTDMNKPQAYHSIYLSRERMFWR